MAKVSDDMKRATGVQKRPGSNFWHWGIKAPSDLKHLYSGQWAHRCSLETSDLRAANTKAAALRAEWLARFERQRQGTEMGPQAASVATPIQLTEALIKEACDLIHVRMLESDEARRLSVLSSQDMESLATVLEVERAQLRQANASGNSWPVENILPTWLQALGLAVSATDPLRPLLARELVKARLRAIQAIQARHTGDLVDTPPPPHTGALEAAQALRDPLSAAAPAMPTGTPKTLRDVFVRWKAAKQRSPDAENACNRSLTLFESKFGHPPLSTITRAMGDQFRALLLTQELTSKTKHDRMTYAKSLLKYACRDLELIPKNPWEGLDIDYRTEKRRKPWSAAQLAEFFGLPLYTEYALPTSAWRAGGAAAYWIPLLGLFTGARIGELCQLRVVDIEQEESGALLHITEEAEGATVKTEAGLRSVPIHSELVRLGFLDYVQALEATSEASLWPAMRFRKGKPSGYFSDWFGEFRREHAPTVPDFHSLRHTVRTAMTEARIAEAVQDRITGHEVKGSMGTRVYAHPKAVLREAVESIQYPRLTLPRSLRGRTYRTSPQCVASPSA